jgi:hypothetical protein
MIMNLLISTLLFTNPVNSDSNTRILRDVNVSFGNYSDKIVIRWEPVENGNYSILRSNFKDRDFTEIASTVETIYEDKDITPGIKYWYRIKLIDQQDPETQSFFDSIKATLFEEDIFITESEYVETATPDINKIKEDLDKDENSEDKAIKGIEKVEVSSQFKNNYSGFALMERPKGENLDQLIAMKKDTLHNPATKEQRDLQKKRLEYLKPYYMNPVQFSIIMLMARPYLNREDLLILTDSSYFEFNNEKNTITFYDKSKSWSVTFESKKMFKIINKAQDMELTRRLLRNAELYCIPSGKKEYLDENGITRIIYAYDAIGLSTRYLKNDSQWRSRTIMLATSRSDLKEQIKKASQTQE